MRALLALIASCLIASFVSAETEITVHGQVRARAESDQKAFAPDAAKRSFVDLRTRVALEAETDANTTAFVQFQDSRRLGGRSADGLDLSGTLTGDANVDVHQAYLHIAQLWRDGPGLRAGRFEVNLGNQRVFGAVGWNNVGRSFEGASLCLCRQTAELTAYWLIRRELDDAVDNRDFDILGVNAQWRALGAETFLFYEHDADKMTGEVLSDFNALDRISAGIHARRDLGPTDMELNAVYQFGDRRFGEQDPFVEQDISAYLFTLELGAELDPDRKARIAAGIDLASGDDDPGDDTFQGYDNLYYTAHKFRGAMDYFTSSNPEGLLDLMLRGQLEVAEGWLARTDVHYFRAAAQYLGSDDEPTRDIGVELDLSLATDRIAGANLVAGLSLFLPDESFAGQNADSGFWGYTMITADF